MSIITPISSPAPLLQFKPKRRSRYDGRMRMAACVVCVPAKNEAKRLPGFLSAMAQAFHQMGDGRGKLIVALDGDGDDSRDILEQQKRHFPVEIEIVSVEPHPTPHAGRVRRAALQAGARSLPLEEVILFTTDADTLVHRNWLSMTRQLMGETDMVCGDIWRDDNAGTIIRAPHEHHYHDLHRLRRQIDPVAFDSDDPHPQGFGASIAMRRDVYYSIDGCPNIPSDEDTAMVRKARQHGYRVRQDRRVKVLTSSRRQGRATGGLAEALVREDAQAAAGEPLLIVDPRRYIDFYRESAKLRMGFARQEEDRVERGVERLGLDRLSVEEAWRVARSADAFISRVLPYPDFQADMTLDRARALLAEARQASAQTVRA